MGPGVKIILVWSEHLACLKIATFFLNDIFISALKNTPGPEEPIPPVFTTLSLGLDFQKVLMAERGVEKGSLKTVPFQTARSLQRQT